MATAKSTPEVPDALLAEDKPDEAVKVTVNPSPAVSKVASDVSAKSDLTVHHELTIAPITAKSEASKTVDVPEPLTSKIEEPKPEVLDAEPQKPVEPAPLVSPKPPIDDAPKTDPKAGGDQEAATMQSPKVFDTKQYHLPIDEGVVHGKGKYVLGLVIALLLLAAAGAVAIDAGWVDVGIKLPFDLIK